MTKNIQKGFTLIELLVVIAIIGILSGILFIAINPAEQTRKADDAAVKTSLSQLRTQAAIDFAASNDYQTLCTANKTKTLYDGAVDSKSATSSSSKCFDAKESYVAAVPINNPETGNYAFCADLNGFAGEITLAQYNLISDSKQECK